MSELHSPRISLCIPAYNAELYIRTTITSCLRQNIPAFEILLSDDGSTDTTRQILDDYADHPIVRLVSPPQRLGLGGHYRHLAHQARGTHLVMLSCDDALHSDFVGTATQILRQRPDLGMLIFSGYLCNAAMKPQSRFGLSYPMQTLAPPAGFEQFINACTYLISFTVWPTALIKALPHLPDEAGFATDWYWALSAGLKNPVKFSRKPLGYYRYHETNASHSDRERWTQQAIAMLNFLANLDWVDPARRKEVASRLKPYKDSGVHTLERQPANQISNHRIKKLLKRLSANSFCSHPDFLR